MSDIAASGPPAAQCLGAFAFPARYRTLALVAAVAALAIGLQLTSGMMADVAWLIEVDERWLAGQVPYRDLFEVNPPASLLLYWPAVALARALSAPSEFMVSAFGFTLCAGSLASSASILRAAKPPPSALVASAIALMALPGQTFCERDQLAAVLGLPFLAVALARAWGIPVEGGRAALAGAGAGVMAAVKPPYALIGVLVALYLARKIGVKRTLGAVEYYVAGAIGLAYVLSTPFLFPHYVSDVLPVGVAAYLPVRESALALLSNPAILLAAIVAALAALTAGERAKRPETAPALAISGLAALGAAAAFVIQGKGWVYQAVPAMMFAAIAAGFAFPPQRAGGLAASLAAVAAACAIGWVHSLGLVLLIGFALAVAVETLLRGWSGSRERLLPLALASAIGAACGLCEIERPLTPTLQAAFARLGPNLTLGALTEDEGLGFPLTRRVGATWTLRSNAMVVTAGVRRLIDEHPGDAALAQRLAPFAVADRARLLQDLSPLPDALLVGPTNTRFHAALMADPEISNLLRQYRLEAVERRPDYPSELWLRKDFVAPSPAG